MMILHYMPKRAVSSSSGANVNLRVVVGEFHIQVVRVVSSQKRLTEKSNADVIELHK